MRDVHRTLSKANVKILELPASEPEEAKANGQGEEASTLIGIGIEYEREPDAPNRAGNAWLQVAGVLKRRCCRTKKGSAAIGPARSVGQAECRSAGAATVTAGKTRASCWISAAASGHEGSR